MRPAFLWGVKFSVSVAVRRGRRTDTDMPFGLEGREGGGAAEREECEEGVESVEGYLETWEGWCRCV